MGSKIDWGKVGTSAAGGVLGMIGGHLSERRNYRNERRLMALQYQNQRGLNQQGHDLQFDMWNKTNAEAQLKHYKDAGLNPALMYESGGPGGTTGSQTGGAAGKGNSQMMKAMDMQNMLLGAEIKLKKELADTEVSKQNDLQSQTDKRDGVDTDLGRKTIEKLISEKLNIDEQKAKTVQEKLNLKTVDEINKVNKALLEIKEDKKVTGSAFVDMMTQIGLDPTNKKEDQDTLRWLIGIIYGSKIADNMMGILTKKGGKFFK